MFSFLKTGDIHNSIRGLTKLPGLFTSDGDKIKYALLNHSTAMRKNLGDGAPIFTNIRQIEAELERRDINSITSGRLPSMAANAVAAAASMRLSPFTDNDIRIDNAALAFIMAKELAFLNRTIQMISLIANRYQEEQDDLAWGNSDIQTGDELGDFDYVSCSPQSAEDLEADADDVPSALQRSHSHPTNEYSDGGSDRSGTQNQLAATFLIASGRLLQRFNGLCELTGSSPVLVNGMTTMDRPHNEANLEKQLRLQSLVISDIFLHFCKFDAIHRDPVVMVFLELRDISVSAWRIMSMFAFSNLFRLTQGTDFAMQYQPEDAIFSQGRDYSLPRQEAAVMQFPLMVAETEAVVTQKDAQEEEEVPEYN
jgi:hypothetical protein